MLKNLSMLNLLQKGEFWVDHSLQRKYSNCSLKLRPPPHQPTQQFSFTHWTGVERGALVFISLSLHFPLEGTLPPSPMGDIRPQVCDWKDGWSLPNVCTLHVQEGLPFSPASIQGATQSSCIEARSGFQPSLLTRWCFSLPAEVADFETNHWKAVR